MPKLERLMGSCTISDGRVTKRDPSARARSTRRVLVTPQTPRKPIAERRVLERIVLDNGTQGMLTAVGSPPPSPYKSQS